MAAIIDARGKSSAASAANAAIDSIHAFQKTIPFSVGLHSQGNPYGIDDDLIFSFPCQMKDGKAMIIEGKTIDPFLREKIKATEKELIEEREMVKHLLK